MEGERRGAFWLLRQSPGILSSRGEPRYAHFHLDTQWLLGNHYPSISMDLDYRFPSKLNSIRDAPERLRRGLVENLSSEESARLLVYAPAFSTADENSPATVLAVTNDGWLVASETAGSAIVQKSNFSDTLLLELTSVLLLGQLRIHFATMGKLNSAITTFETTGEDLYREAIDLVLRRIDETDTSEAEHDRDAASIFKDWPTKFRIEADHYRPKGQRLLAAIHWPAVSGGFQRELCPAAALLVTKRELVLISEVKTPPRQLTGELNKLPVSQKNAEPAVLEEEFPRPKVGGTIVTYFPRVRLAASQVSHHERFGVLALQAHAAHGGERLEIIFPSDRENIVSDAVKQA